MTDKSRWWSADEDARLLSAGAVVKRAGWDNLARDSFPGRTGFACRVRYGILRRKAAGIEPVVRLRAPSGHDIARIQRVKDEERALAEAQAAQRRRHPTITGYVFGDPLPGRSALDRRNAGAGA